MRTDQKDCYDGSGRTVSCRKTGQDGETRTGRQWPNPRFIQDNDTVKDRMTGLIWPRNAGKAVFPLTWKEAFDFADELNKTGYCGLDNWRLPSRDELFSLISHTRMNPAVTGADYFHNIFNGYYWTATPCARYPSQAWYIHMGGGRLVKGMVQSSYMVWPVHDSPDSPQFSSAPAIEGVSPLRFKTDRNTVSDRITGLTWMQDADLVGKPVTWEQALSTVQQLNSDKWLGYTDWRLPNVRELESLTDLTVHSPAVAARRWTQSVRPFYWSSTTSVYDPAYAWTLYTDDGNIGVGFKANPEFYVWPVRTSETAAVIPDVEDIIKDRARVSV